MTDPEASYRRIRDDAGRESGTLAHHFIPMAENRMRRCRGLDRFHRTGCFYFFSGAALLLAIACAPGSGARLTTVGCADPSCNQELPETRKVLGCMGKACNEAPPPGAAEKAASPADEASETAPPPVAMPGKQPAAPQKAEADREDTSSWDVEVHYEKFERR